MDDAKSPTETRPISHLARAGQLLMEILVALAVTALIVGLGAQMIVAGLRSNKAAGERNVALGIANQTFEGIRSATAENWLNLYNLATSSNHYFPQQSNTKWVLTSGDDTVIINSVSYTRYFTVASVSRDPITRDIEGTYAAADDDPSSRKITVTVSWPNSAPVSSSEFISRWRNKVCSQTDWTTGGSSAMTNCPDTIYGTSSNISASSTLQLCSGGC